jgi:hypothetical protein
MAFIRRALSRIGVDRDNHLQSMEEGLSRVLLDHGKLTSTTATQDLPSDRPTTPPNTTTSSERALEHTPTKVRILEVSSPLAIRVST